MFGSSKQRTVSRIVFGIYLFLLAWLVLFKFSVSIRDLPHIRGINLIPFYYDKETSTHLSEVVYNVMIFIPLGVYLQIFRANRKIITKILAVLFTSLFFESIQFIFAIGASDITDIIVNTFGGLIGIAFCIIMKRLFPKRYISVINSSGLLIEAGGVGLLALLLAANC